jgi:hypothetical protein
MERPWGNSLWAIIAAVAVASCSGTPPAGSTSAAPVSDQTQTTSPTLAPRPTGLFVGGFAQITVAELNVRTGPSVNAPPLQQGNPDAAPTPVRWGKTSGFDRVFILGGPVDADGYRWWQVWPTVYVLDGVTRPAPSAPYPDEIGWVAGGQGDDAWLVSADECPAPPVDLADITLSAASWGVRLGCFQGQVLTLRGWLTTLPSEEPVPGPSDTPVAGPAIFPVQMGWFDDNNVNRLDFRLHPAMNLKLPAPEQWVEVTGSFNDPSASICEQPYVLECRATFTVTFIRPLGP